MIDLKVRLKEVSPDQMSVCVVEIPGSDSTDMEHSLADFLKSIFEQMTEAEKRVELN